MNLSIKFAPEECRTLAFGGIGVNYAAVGLPFDNPIRIFLLENLTDATLWFSFDGVTNHFPLYTLTSMILDVTANKTQKGAYFIAAGGQIYVKRLDVPTAGSVYVTGFYGANN